MTKLAKRLAAYDFLCNFVLAKPGKAQGGRRLAEVISRRKTKTTRNTFKKYD